MGRREADHEEVPAATIDDVVLSTIPDDEIVTSFDNGMETAPSANMDLERPITPAPPTFIRPSMDSIQDRQKRYDAALTPAIWELATKNANATVDLLVCLERQQNIGFRYADVDLTRLDPMRDVMSVDSYDPPLSRISSSYTSSSTASRERMGSTMRGQNRNVVTLNGMGTRNVNGEASLGRSNGMTTSSSTVSSSRIMIHHGSKDARVPLENVKWLTRTMRGVELRVVEGEGHGLMSNASVMAQVLTELSKELEAL